MPTTTTTGKTRTITLTDRRPIRIAEDGWPVIAQASDWTPRNNAESQANRRWSLTVRQHETDGRTIVYGVYTSQWIGESDIRGGELLTPPEGADISADEWYVWPEIVAAIHRVAEHLCFMGPIVDACIADLPAETLT